MHAADVAQACPVVRVDDSAMAAVETVVAHDLPGLVVVDEVGRVVACLSSVDLLRLALPAYLRDQPCLSRVIGEAAADRIAVRLVDVPLRQLVTGAEGTVPEAAPTATLVELAELMSRCGCALALVRSGQDGTGYGVVTVNRLLAALAAGASGERNP